MTTKKNKCGQSDGPFQSKWAFLLFMPCLSSQMSGYVTLDLYCQSDGYVNPWQIIHFPQLERLWVCLSSSNCLRLFKHTRPHRKPDYCGVEWHQNRAMTWLFSERNKTQVWCGGGWWQDWEWDRQKERKTKEGRTNALIGDK